jgi:hypothetical protein
MENTSAENRNMTTRASDLRNMIRAGRRCSFCRTEGHFINNCNDSRINEFENECKTKKELLDSQWVDGNSLDISQSLNQSLNRFKNWLMEYSVGNTNIVKAFSMARCNGLLRDTIYITIDKITRYIYYTLNEEDDDSLPSLVDDDFIPFQATQEVNQFDIDLFMTLSQMLALQSVDGYNLRNPDAIRELLNEARANIHSIKVTVMEEEVTPEKIDDNLYTQHECNICYDTKDHYEFVKLNCDHEFCNKCVIDTIKMCKSSSKDPFCGFCRKTIETIKTRSEEVKSNIDDWLDPTFAESNNENIRAEETDTIQQEFQSWLTSPYRTYSSSNHEYQDPNMEDEEAQSRQEQARQEELNEYMLYRQY